MAGPVLDQEAVAGICRRARRLGGAEHAVQLLQQQACDPLGRERRDARRARPRNETDHREGWQRLWPHCLRRRREPHLQTRNPGSCIRASGYVATWLVSAVGEQKGNSICREDGPRMGSRLTSMRTDLV
eukprot:5176959-Pleurochrysis_carterae.AAC.1